MRKRALIPLALLSLLPLAATVPAAAAGSGGPVPIAEHLNNPRQMTFGPDGTLYVAEAGSGAVNATVTGKCFSGPEGKACTGNTGSITGVRHPGTAGADSGRRVVTGLLSFAGKDGSFATGLDAIDFAPDGKPYGIITAAPPNSLPRSLARQAGQVITEGRGDRVATVADIAAYSFAHPNPGHEPDSNPYGIAAMGRTIFVVDAANNSLLKVTRDGRISTLHVFPYRHGSNGFDTVPTSVVVGPDHMLYVGTLASFVPGAAKVYVVNPDTGRVVRTIDGLTTVSAVAVGANGTVYAAELFAGCPPDDHSCTPGRVAVIPQQGERHEIEVPLPGGVAVHEGHLYVSVLAVVPGGGAVWRLR